MAEKRYTYLTCLINYNCWELKLCQIFTSAKRTSSHNNMCISNDGVLLCIHFILI